MNGPIDTMWPSSFAQSASNSNLEFKARRISAPLFLEGSTNLRTSSMRDHARSDMYRRAMALSRREQGQGSYATDQSPIVKALSRMDASGKKIILGKFEISYTVVKENIAFVKMKTL